MLIPAPSIECRIEKPEAEKERQERCRDEARRDAISADDVRNEKDIETETRGERQHRGQEKPGRDAKEALARLPRFRLTMQ